MWQSAAQYPNTFYGQLAISKINPTREFTLPEDPEVSKQTYNKIRRDELTSVIEMLLSADKTKDAKLFATKLSMQAKTDEEKVATIDVLMKHLKSPALAVSMSVITSYSIHYTKLYESSRLYGVS